MKRARSKSRSKRKTKSKCKLLKCNAPTKSWRKLKKIAVLGCENGRKKCLHFGAVGFRHNYSKKAKKSFRARHKCSTAKSKLTARHWACKILWPKNRNEF